MHQAFKRLASLAAIGMAFASTVVGITDSAPSAATVSSKAATPKPDFAYFAGKTITLIFANSVTSAGYTQAADLVPYVERYLHATVNLIANPAGNQILGQDQAASAAPDGLTIGWDYAGNDIIAAIQNQPNIDFSLEKQVIIAGVPSANNLLVACPGSGITSLKQLLHSTSPVKFISTAVGNPNYSYNTALMGAYGTPAQMIGGYASVAAQFAGCLRGDGQVDMWGTSNLVLPIQQNEVVPLLLGQPVKPGTIGYAQLRKVPTIASLLASDKPKTAKGRAALEANLEYFTGMSQLILYPTGTPLKYALAMRKAFDVAFKDAKDQLISQDVGYTDLTPQQALASIKTQFKKDPVAAAYATQYGG